MVPKDLVPWGPAYDSFLPRPLQTVCPQDDSTTDLGDAHVGLQSNCSPYSVFL